MEAMHNFYANPATKPKLDPSLYSLEGEELTFFQVTTGITDEEELKEHILRVQKKAYDIHGYPCIRRFNFLRLRIARLPGYPKALALLEERKDPIFLDIGCCFGNDTRKVVLDGWPAHEVIASDLIKGFWECGHELFRSTPESFPVAFVQGDVFDTSFLPISTEKDLQVSEERPLASLTSLSPLRQRLSAIHASALFHLFSETQQHDLARRLASLLLPQKGSIIFGAHVSRPVKGFRSEVLGERGHNILMFCHSPDSWRRMWVEDVFSAFPGIQVHVEANLVDYLGVNLKLDDTVAVEGGKFYEMQWSVEIVRLN